MRDIKWHERFWSKVNKNHPNGCWIWESTIANKKYGQFWLHGKYEGAHRIAWFITNGVLSLPDGFEVCHKCDNPPCVNPDHLSLGTRSDNMKDMCNKSRNHHNHAVGSKSSNAKLTEKKVIGIRELSDNGYSDSTIGKWFNIDKSTINRIVNNKIWRHV